MAKVLKFHDKKQQKKKIKEDTFADNTLYSMNKQIMQDRKTLTPLELAAIQPKIEDWFNMIIDTYAMLLCHERRDYTVFHLYETQNQNPPAVAASEFLDCLTDRGEILSIDPTPDKAWEIWLKIDNTPYCYYLFRYDNAVIEC